MEKGIAAVTDMFKNTKFFNQVSKRGETYELKAELNADTKDKRKEAVKKVIANMTIGKDVSMLFADVVKNMQTEDLELKKLVYLYLMNYAKSQPELVILAVNTFVKDSDDNNPLIRALAIRTMGCLRVGKILDYICEPLKKGLKDDHPYVRKTAAICVAKLHEMNAQLCYESGMIQVLQDMLSDPNPMVVANSVAALLEIRETSSRRDILQVNTQLLNKLLTALNECTEWGQVCILEAFAAYQPVDYKEAELIVERVIPRLQHVNSAVVLGAVKVLIAYLDYVQTDEVSKNLVKKLAPPLVTLLSSPFEVQYVALRNIDLILQKKPEILANEMRVFFCKFNDPPYVKMEKLEIMIKLASERNVDQVISELKEYANEVDVEFVRKAIQAIGRCAIKIDSSAERCVAALLDLIKNKVNYVVQEAIIVMKDIFRKYPDRYEAIIPTLCENLDSLDEPEAKAAMIWIIGENAQRIDNAHELIQYFSENYKFETTQVQLQLLTAAVKLFLKKPQNSQELVQNILQSTAASGESADLRDKAYIYWRLLSGDPNATKTVVLAQRPPISDDMSALNPALLQEMIKSLGSIASVYHKPASAFLGKGYTAIPPLEGQKAESDEEAGQGETVNTNVADLLDLDFGGEVATSPPIAVPQSSAGGGGLVDFDLLADSPPKPSNMMTSPPIQPTSTSPIQQLVSSPFVSQMSAVSPAPPSSKQVLLSAQQAKGLQLSASFSRRQGSIFMDITLENKSMAPMTDFAIQFNKNSFGLIPVTSLDIGRPLAPNQSADVSLSLGLHGPIEKTTPLNLLQCAVKNNVEPFYFQTNVQFRVFFVEEPLDQQTYMTLFQSEPTAAAAIEWAVTSSNPFEDVKKQLMKSNLIVLHQPSPTTVLWSVKLTNGIPVAGEVIAQGQSLKFKARCKVQAVLAALKEEVEGLLRQQ